MIDKPKSRQAACIYVTGSVSFRPGVSLGYTLDLSFMKSHNIMKRR